MGNKINRLPTVAYGTTYTTDEAAYESVTAALEAGYRVINTCAAYENERGMGRAIKASGIPREELTIISLDSNTKRSAEDAENFDGYKAQLAQIYDSLACAALYGACVGKAERGFMARYGRVR
jgi:diketogulonate reductase-like aldo/keto reductase